MAANMSTAVQEARLVALRRIYLYFVAGFCLTALQLSVRTLGEGLGWLWAQRAAETIPVMNLDPMSAILEPGSLALVAVLFFAVHWNLAQGYVQRMPDERASVWRRVFLLLTVTVALYLSSAYVAELVYWPLHLVWQPTLIRTWPLLTALAPLIGLILSGTILGHFVRLLYQERAVGADSRCMRLLTGVWFTLVATSVLALGISSASDSLSAFLLELTFRLLPRASWSTTMIDLPAALAVSWVSLGVLGCLVQLRTPMFRTQWPTQTTDLHIAWLYVGQLTGIVLLAMSLLWFLADGLSQLWHRTLPDPVVLVVYLPGALTVGLLCWFWFRRQLKRTTEQHPEGPWPEFLHQTYLYLVAVLGLIWFVRGCAGVTGYFLLYMEPVATAPTPTPDFWTRVSELVVAIVLLVPTWRILQTHTVRDHGDNQWTQPTWPRRVYLYGVILFATLSLLFLVGQILYGVLQRLVDQPGAIAFPELDLMPVMTVILLLHLLLLRQDRRSAESTIVPAADTRTALHQELHQLRLQEVQLQARIVEVQQALQEEDEALGPLEDQTVS